MVFLIQQTMLYAIPLMIVALAGIFAERSGVINLALEGIMIIGAFVGALFVRIMQENQVFTQEQGQLLMLLALVVSAIFGAIFSLLLAFSAINLKADQTIGGTALNMLGLAASTVIVKAINISANPDEADRSAECSGNGYRRRSRMVYDKTQHLRLGKRP